MKTNDCRGSASRSYRFAQPRRWRWLQGCLIALLLVGMLPTTAVFAHPKIVSIDPPPDSQLDTGPNQIRIVFDEPVEAAFAHVRLYNEQAQTVDNGSGGRSETNPTMLELTPPPLPAGIYTVIWQIVGSDGHKVTGNFSFTVLAGSTTPLPTSQIAPTPVPTRLAVMPLPEVVLPPQQEPPLLLIALVRALALLGATVFMAGLIWLYGIVQPIISSTLPLRVIQRWRWVMLVGLLVLIGGSLGFLLIHTQQIANRVDRETLVTVVVQTRLGQALGIRVFLALLVLGVLFLPFGRLQFAAGSLMSAVMLLTFSASGHASAQTAPFLPVLSDWIHLAATSVWLGGLVYMVFVLPLLLHYYGVPKQISILSQIIQRFSLLALGSVASLLLSGSYAAFLHLSSFSDFWTTTYGQTLLVKLIFFAGMVSTGVYQMLIVRTNMADLAQRVAEQVLVLHWQARFLKLVRGEVLLGMLVMICVGLLTSIAPANRTMNISRPGLSTTPEPVRVAVASATPQPPTRTPVPGVVFDQAQQVGDLNVTLRVEPASLGNNRLQIQIRDTAGSLIRVQKVVLFTTMTEMEMGETRIDAIESQPGIYVLEKEWFSMVGDWAVRISIRRADADDTEATFIVPVGD